MGVVRIRSNPVKASISEFKAFNMPAGQRGDPLISFPLKLDKAHTDCSSVDGFAFLKRGNVRALESIIEERGKSAP
jgi:hypothetical protein